jgi:hypothetical protein
MAALSVLSDLHRALEQAATAAGVTLAGHAFQIVTDGRTLTASSGSIAAVPADLEPFHG